MSVDQQCEIFRIINDLSIQNRIPLGFNSLGLNSNFIHKFFQHRATLFYAYILCADALLSEQSEQCLQIVFFVVINLFLNLFDRQHAHSSEIGFITCTHPGSFTLN